VGEVICPSCAEAFTRSPRHKNQTFCMKPQCRRARKASLQRNKMKTDPEYRADQKLSNRKWSASRPDYWREYRRRHEDKTQRNRLLQTVRDRNGRAGREAAEVVSTPLAKMDAWERKTGSITGRYWLIPISTGAVPVQAHIVAVSHA
jgi:hypothetical protein